MRRWTGWILVAAAGGLAAAGCGDDTPTTANKGPVIRDLILSPESVVLGGKTRIASLASDPDGDPVTYQWTADAGTIDDPGAHTVFWTAPEAFGDYTVRLVVSDGSLFAEDSVLVPVGEGSVYVTSDPPGAFISLDGVQTGLRTPHLFDPLARGPHGVSLTSNDWKYDRGVTSFFLGHGQEDTVSYRTLPASIQILNLGRDDFGEIGGMTYLRSGIGVVYSARSDELGLGIYSSAITPATGAPNAVLLTDDVSLDEPLAVYSTDSLLVWTNAGGQLVAAEIVNENGDGVIDFLRGGRIWSSSGGYGVTTALPNLVAVSLTPSFEAEAAPIFHGLAGTAMPPGFIQATTTFGRQPAWDPGGLRLAYQLQGRLLWVFADGTNLGSPDTLQTDGYCQLPAWGPFGPRHLAYAQGSDELNAFEVRLQVVPGPQHVTVFTGLFDVRDLAWSPAQRVLAVSHNPGSAQMVLLFNLPIP